MKRVNTLAILAFILLIPPEASAQYPSFAAFTPPSKEYVVQSDLIEVTNLPKVPAQGGRGSATPPLRQWCLLRKTASNYMRIVLAIRQTKSFHLTGW